jgi:hypothetical protein
MVKTRLNFLWWQPKANSNAFANGCVTLSHSGTPSDADIFHSPPKFIFIFYRRVWSSCECPHPLV